jgi:hypothetical protein
MTIYSRTEIAGMAERAAAQHGDEAENPFPQGTAAHDAFAASLERCLVNQVGEGVEQSA